MVWYGVQKTGVPEIDMDHANIDTYLNFAMHHGLTPNSFEQMVQALILHFQREEDICSRLQLNMTQDHLDEHQRLIQVLRAINIEEKSQDDHLLFFKQTLLTHISEFDCHINQDFDD